MSSQETVEQATEETQKGSTGSKTKSRLSVILICDVDPAWLPHERKKVNRQCQKLVNALRRFGHSVKVIPIIDSDLAAVMSVFNPGECIVLNWCESLPGINHGEPLVAEILETLHFTFTGSSSKTLTLSANKEKVKQILNRGGVACPKWRVFSRKRRNGWRSFPAIVKPAFEHCSLGVGPESVVTTAAELQERVDYVIETFHQPAIVEDFISGREFHVGVLGSENPQVLPPIEMDFSAFDDMRRQIYSYDAKFSPRSHAFNATDLIVPAPITDAEFETLKTISLKTYRLLGCRDYARIDLRLRDGVFYVLDVNPNPDLTDVDSLAYAAKTAGYSYGNMVSRILEYAALRHPSSATDGNAALQAGKRDASVA